MSLNLNISSISQYIISNSNKYQVIVINKVPLLCECGCGKIVEQKNKNKRFFNGACRTREYRRRLDRKVSKC